MLATLVMVVASSTSTPFAGSWVVVQTSASVNTVAPGLQLSANPSVVTSLLLSPRFAIDDDWAMSGRWALSAEHTHSDVTDTINELEVSDLTLAAHWSGLPRVMGVKSVISGGLTVPLSESTRASTMLFALGLGLELDRAFFDDAIGVALSGSYRRPFHQYTTPGVDSLPARAPRCFGGALGCEAQLSGVANPRDVLSWGLQMTGSVAGFTPGAAFQMTHVIPYEFRDLEGVGRLADRSNARTSTYFSLWLSYALLEMMRVELGYYLERNLLGGDGQIGNPFLDQYQDMRLYLSVGVDVAELARSLR